MGSLSPVPLTERILGVLGRPRLLWVLLWGSSSGFLTEAAARLGYIPAALGLRYSLASIYVNVVALWAVGVGTRRMREIEPRLNQLLGDGGPRDGPFALMGSVPGTLIAVVLLNLVGQLLVFRGVVFREASVANIGIALAILIAWLPANSSVWVVGAFLLGLDRVGRSSLRLLPPAQDRTLGLRPLGSLAFTVYMSFSVAMIPLVYGSVGTVAALMIEMALYVAITVLFVMSLQRLHEQLVRAKAQQVSEARSLMVHTLTAVREHWSQDAVGLDAARLTAAEVIARQAEAIMDWPFDPAMLRQMAAVFLAVITSILARLVLRVLGL